MKKVSIEEDNARVYRNVMRLLHGKNKAEICREVGLAESTLATQIKRQEFQLSSLFRLRHSLGFTIGEICDERLELDPGVAVRIVQEIESLLAYSRTLNGTHVADPEDIVRRIIGRPLARS